MYLVKTIFCKQFINDSSIRAPRFQRKLVWKNDKNFEFCISFFNEFPIGVVVVKQEKPQYINILENGKKRRKMILDEQKYILDGRQRHNILTDIYSDPEKIYEYAKRYIGIKNNMGENEIRELFWKKVEMFLQTNEENEDNSEEGIDTEEDIDTEDEDNTIGNEDENISLGDDEEIIEDENESEDKKNTIENYQSSYLERLENLLEIILAVHPKKENSSAFTKPFDFSSYLKKLEYVEDKEEVKKLVSKELVIWIRNFKLHLDNRNIKLSKAELIKYLESKYDYKDINCKRSLEKYIKKNWKNIEFVISICSSIDSRMNSAEIGWIVLEDCTAKESQKIYEIINTKGTPLTNPEILSAKAEWNISIESDDIELIRSVKNLYETMKISVPEGIVKWDIAATFIDRLGDNFIFGNLSYNNASQFNIKINMGFKLLSGIILNKIDQNGIADLGNNKDIEWNSFTKNLLNELKEIIKLLKTDKFFENFDSYKCSLLYLTSEAIVLNFIIIIHKDWLRKGKPSNNNQNSKDFILNAKILFDKLIYQYVNRELRGSSDSEVARRLNDFNNYQESLITRLENEEWKDLIENVIENHVIREKPLSYKNIDKMLKIILIYYYVLEGLKFTGDKVNFDHIIPKVKLEERIEEWKIKSSNLFNLCILPDSTNREKYNKLLNEIKNYDMKVEIKNFTGIELDDFEKYSDINNIDKLKEFRKKLFIKAFDDRRKEKLNISN